eukprot:12573115-Ditylum_brightwellii.AAC.1
MAKRKRTKRVKWSNKFNSDKESTDEGEIKIDDSEAYKPINPNINSTERRVYNLRSRKKYKTNHDGEYEMDRDDMDDITCFALTQYSLKQGLKKFQQAGEDAVKEEFLQLHNKETFKPIAPDELTSEQQKSALKSLMFITKK